MMHCLVTSVIRPYVFLKDLTSSATTQLLHDYVKDVSFPAADSDPFSFTQDGDASGLYNIYNYHYVAINSSHKITRDVLVNTNYTYSDLNK